MAKTNFLSWDTTANNNTDIDGIGILGSNAVNNFDNAFRTLMAQLRSGVDGRSVYAAKSANYTAVLADNNAIIRFTATATLSLTAAATLTASWHAIIWADGGDVTIDPNGAELINSAATVTIPNGTMSIVTCTGTSFVATGIPSVMTLISTLVGASAGPILDLFRNAAPVADNILGQVVFNGLDSAGNKTDYADILAIVKDSTNGSEDAELYLRQVIAGSIVNKLICTLTGVTINGTLTVTG